MRALANGNHLRRVATGRARTAPVSAKRPGAGEREDPGAVPCRRAAIIGWRLLRAGSQEIANRCDRRHRLATCSGWQPRSRHRCRSARLVERSECPRPSGRGRGAARMDAMRKAPHTAATRRVRRVFLAMERKRDTLTLDPVSHDAPTTARAAAPLRTLAPFPSSMPFSEAPAAARPSAPRTNAPPTATVRSPSPPESRGPRARATSRRPSRRSRGAHRGATRSAADRHCPPATAMRRSR